jgi:AcrR family transcriptional regulator
MFIRMPVDDDDTAKLDALLDAALDLFCDVGYAATPVPKIAERAGIAVGSVYRHFTGKEQLVNALYRREKARMLEATLDGIDPAGDPEATFREVWGRLARFAAAHPRSLSFLEMHHHEAYLDDESRALARNGDRAVARLVRSWQRRGAVRKGDPDVLHALVFGGFVSVVRQKLNQGQPVTPALGTATIDAAWGLLAAPQETT